MLGNYFLMKGVCKLGDFGWATLCDERRKTYCGTTDYVSPEIV
jgi:serine/threonine protein kinase